MKDESSIQADLAVAGQAVAAGDFRHALGHIGPVLLEQPESAEALQLLARVAAQFRGDPLTLLDLENEVYAGTVAVAAMLCARGGKSDLALSYLLQVAQAMPQTAMLVWLRKWSGDAAFVRALSTDAAGTAILGFAFGAGAAQLTEVLDALENLRLHAPENPRLAHAHAMVLRRLERFDEALAVAEDVLGSATDFESVVGLAATYREAGRLPEALAAFERASQIDPAHTDVFLDVGDVHLELRQYERRSTRTSALSSSSRNSRGRSRASSTRGSNWETTPSISTRSTSWRSRATSARERSRSRRARFSDPCRLHPRRRSTCWSNWRRS
jgi:tetratricopeptide (TPR) repeat protein